jgi:hypothetical protein
MTEKAKRLGNEPAFPVAEVTGETKMHVHNSGFSKYEEIAKSAMCALLSNPSFAGVSPEGISALAKKYAYALLEELVKADD